MATTRQVICILFKECWAFLFSFKKCNPQTEKDRSLTQMHVLHSSYFASPHSVHTPAFFCSINHPLKSNRLNRGGCCTASLSFFKGYFLYRVTLFPPHASAAYQPLATCMFYSDSFHSLFSLVLVTRIDSNYIKSWKVWIALDQNAQTASVLSCAAHWLMSGAGHFTSRQKISFKQSWLSIKCDAHTPTQNYIYFYSHRAVIYLLIYLVDVNVWHESSPICFAANSFLQVFDGRGDSFPLREWQGISVHVYWNVCVRACISAYDEPQT